MPSIVGGYIEFAVPGRPDNTLPGGGYYPSHPIAPGGGGPVDPGYGQGGLHPGHPIAPGGGRPVDPGWGVGEGRPDHGLPGGGGSAGQLPVFPPPGGGAAQLPVLPPPPTAGQLPSGPGGSAGQLPTVPGLQPGQLPVWPPTSTIPPGPDNTLPPTPLPPGYVSPPIYIPDLPAGPNVALGYFPGSGWHYAVIVTTATPPAGGIGGTPPPRPGPGVPGQPVQPMPPAAGQLPEAPPVGGPAPAPQRR